VSSGQEDSGKPYSQGNIRVMEYSTSSNREILSAILVATSKTSLGSVSLDATTMRTTHIVSPTDLLVILFTSALFFEVI
jgi:hypothetical protein